jgi:hypothetical protein
VREERRGLATSVRVAAGRKSLPLATQTLFAGGLTAFLGWLPFLIAAPGDTLDQTIGFLGIQDLQRLPFPLEPDTADPNKLLELWAPAILVAGSAAWALHATARRTTATGSALAPLALAGLAYLFARTDEFHLVPLAAVLPVMLVAAATRERNRAAAAALVAVTALVAAHGLTRKAGQLLHPPTLATVPGPAGDGVRADDAEARDLGRVLALVQRRTPPGEPIFVAPPRFDQVTVGNPLLYVLADRPNPTRYDVMQPGVVTTESVQREIVADLRRARPVLLVRWRDPRTRPEPNGGGRSSGVRLLDGYLDATYRRVATHGAYEVLQRSRRENSSAESAPTAAT